MAILFNQATGAEIHLHSIHVFGRHPLKSDTVLDNVDASLIHATVRWNGAGWEIWEHSRNGTMVDGKRLTVSAPVLLEVGQRIQCGPGGGHFFRVISLDAPCAMLVPVGGGAALILVRSHLLPDDEQPEVGIHRRADGRWMHETTNDLRCLEAGDLVCTKARAWTFVSPSELAPTLDARGWSHCALRTCFEFTVSLNEEHTHLFVQHGAERLDLGERAHHYTLLILARQRRDDAALGTDETSHGWINIERLSRMLGLDPAHLNIQIYRVRKQLSLALPEGAPLDRYIERRRGEVRFGAFDCRITRGSSLETSFVSPSLASANVA